MLKIEQQINKAIKKLKPGQSVSLGSIGYFLGDDVEITKNALIIEQFKSTYPEIEFETSLSNTGHVVLRLRK